MEVFHFETRTEEHHHFLVPVLSKEGKQQQEPFLGRTHDITLKHQLEMQCYKLLYISKCRVPTCTHKIFQDFKYLVS